MNKGQKNTQYSANHYLKSKAQVIEYCLSEEDESCFQSNLAPASYKTNNVSVHSKSTWIKTHSRIGSNVTADSINDYSQAIQDKENIGDKPKDFYLKNIQTMLNQKPNVTNTKPNGKALNEISNQSNILPKNKIPLEASYASGLLADLDNNIQEFRNLLSVNLPKLDTKEKPTFENGQGHEDSRVLEISRLTLKLEESKFCTENETSELKMLKEFETAHSHPTKYHRSLYLSQQNSCSLLERSLDDNRAPDLTESLQFDKPWNLMDSKANYCSGTVQATNTGYTTNTHFLRDGARMEELTNHRSLHGKERSHSPNFHSRKVSDTDGTFGVFREDYESVFESFKRIMPDFSTKSHIVRYLKGHEHLGNEFLYSVMLDLKEVEKNVFLMHHQSSAREKDLQNQVNEIGRLSSNNQEAPNSQFRGEKTTGRGEAKSSRGDSGVITMYMRKHYQTLLQRINEFYGQKLEILKQSLSSMEKYDATKFAVGEVFDDLVEELGIEEMQGVLSDNLKKIKDVHNLIGDMWNEKNHTYCGNESENNRMNKQQVLKTEGNIKTSMDFNSTGFLTTIRHDGFEAKKENTIMEESCEIKDIEYRGEDENETRLNISEVEALRVECLLKEKENEINIIRKKEQVYQNLIRSLTMELKEARRQNTHAQTLTTQNDE